LQCAEELRQSPHWALSVMACPDCHSDLSLAETVFQCASCGPVGQWKDGIACFERGRGASDGDESIKWYQSIGGTHYHERAQIPLSMSALDTPVYHQWLLEIAPERLDGPILDVGAGDGRQTDLWLSGGHQRVVAVDAVSESLSRFRSRLAAEHPDRLDNLLLIECDVRRMPLRSSTFRCISAIEVLYYLNEDYCAGLAECARLLDPAGRILVSERAWEGALLTRLLYDGIEPMLETYRTRDMWDGYGEKRVRSRAFREDELIDALERVGLFAIETKGLSLLSLVCGFLHGKEMLGGGGPTPLAELHDVLRHLGDSGSMRRTHVVVAGKSAMGAKASKVKAPFKRRATECN
jgi:ubiquinone/menaquinone biosynthesis C-methylase UbiE